VALYRAVDFLQKIRRILRALRAPRLCCSTTVAYPEFMGDESIVDEVESEAAARPTDTKLPVATPLPRELRRTLILLVIFVALLLIRFR
jgi:hypothetical protein